MLEVKNIHKKFGSNEVLKGVDFKVEKGSVIAVLGNSGSGKTTLLRCISFLEQADQGEITFDDFQKDITAVTRKEIKELRMKMGFVFQGYNLFRNKTALQNVLEGLTAARKISVKAAQKRAMEMLGKVGMENRANFYPDQLSGGMSQRVMIAMAMSCEPDLLIADEPTTALDVTIQAQILELMKKIQQDKGMSILLITHDLGVVAEMCSRVIVMYAGKIVEEAPVEILFANPTHPYTQGLIASVPKLGSGVKVLPSIPGSVPDLSAMPKGCRFAPRCKYATEKCHQEQPELLSVGEKQKCRCWLKQ